MPSGAFSPTHGRELTTEDLRSLLWEPLESLSVVLAAVTTLGGQLFPSQGVPVRVPRIDAWPLADVWRAENELIAESNPEFGELVLLPASLKSLKVLHRFSSELARHSAAVGVARALGESLVRRIGLAWDRAALFGAGTVDGNGNRDVLGLANTSGIQVMPGIGVPNVDDLHDAVGLLLGANASLGSAAWFMHSRDFTSLRKTKDANGQYLVQPDPTQAGAYQLLGGRVLVSNELPTTLGAGANESFALLVDVRQIAVAQDVIPDYQVLSETYGQYDQSALRVVARMDIAALNPEGIVKLAGITKP